MRLLFIHQNFPAQFGHIAAYLSKHKGYRCTFVSEKAPARIEGIELIQYRIRGGATRQTHYCSRTFENAIWHTHAVYEALGARPDIRPDLIVRHSGFGSTLFLRELYDCPIINYFEYFYRPHNSDMDFRPDFPSTELDRLRALARNAMILLDLQNCELHRRGRSRCALTSPRSARKSPPSPMTGLDVTCYICSPGFGPASPLTPAPGGAKSAPQSLPGFL
jgi:hypothetical protein